VRKRFLRGYAIQLLNFQKFFLPQGLSEFRSDGRNSEHFRRTISESDSNPGRKQNRKK